MAVSLGIWYDSDSPQVCDVECYTLIRGAEFREVSLVYHPGFPIATIEAVEVALRKRAKTQINTENYARHIENIIDGTGTTDSSTISFTTFTDTGTNAFSTQPMRITSNEQRDFRLQPKMSLPKTTGELKIPNNPEVKKPQDTMKEKKKAEDSKKKLKKNSKRKSTQEKRRGNSRRKVKARKLK